MDTLNYHHLFYFHTVAKKGSIARAAQELQLTQPTISEQIRLLEKSLDRPLFDRVGRSLVLTDIGKTVLAYAEKIFSLGNDLTAALAHPQAAQQSSLTLGIDRSLSSSVVAQILAPLDAVLHCHCDSVESLLTRADLDLVLSASRPKSTNARQLLDAPTLFLAKTAVRSLKAQPFLLPPAPMRDAVLDFFRAQKIKPAIAAAFDSPDLTLALAQQGRGICAAPDLKNHTYPGLKVVGRTRAIRWPVFAITRDRQPANPLVRAILKGR